MAFKSYDNLIFNLELVKSCNGHSPAVKIIGSYIFDPLAGFIGDGDFLFPKNNKIWFDLLKFTIIYFELEK